MKVVVDGELIALTREIVAEWSLQVLRALAWSPQGPEPRGNAGYKGFYYHFQEGLSLPSAGSNGESRTVRSGPPNYWLSQEVSAIDTALAIWGILFVSTFFDRDNPVENEIRSLGTFLFERVEWNWLLREDGLIGHGWIPETEKEAAKFIPYAYGGYNEAILLYLLALAAPDRYKVSPESYRACMRNQRVVNYLGIPLLETPGMPAFLVHFPQGFIPFEGIGDPLNRKVRIDYQELAGNLGLAQWLYAVKNQEKGHGPESWGFSAGDGKGNYKERGAPDVVKICEDGTISPPGAMGFLPFAPGLVIPTLRGWCQDPRIFYAYGLVGGYNLEQNWFMPESLAIDQGEIGFAVINYMSGFIWDVMKDNEVLRRGLQAADFRTVDCRGSWLETDVHSVAAA
jgi:hypothetical protein